MGMNCNSLGGLLRRILAKQLGRYINARAGVVLAPQIAQGMAAAGPFITPDEIGVLCDYIADGKPDLARELAAMRRPTADLTASLNRLKGRLTTDIEKYGRSLDRLRENVQDQECQVCLLPWEEGTSRFILNCCQIVVCEYCIVRKGHGKAVSFVQVCPSCSRPVDSKAIIKVGDNILDLALGQESLDAAALSTGEEEHCAPAPVAKQAGPASELASRIYDETRDSKLRALVEIVQGSPVTAEEEEEGEPIGGLMGSDCDIVVPPDGGGRRLLVFALHGESTRLISRTFTQHGLAHLWLQGTRKQKDVAVQAFKAPFREGEPYKVMLVTASRDCAGLHLPECTDLVFYHRIRDVSISQQVAGRGQRQGREYSLRIHRLLFPGE
jgi:hypothetical protein